MSTISLKWYFRELNKSLLLTFSPSIFWTKQGWKEHGAYPRQDSGTRQAANSPKGTNHTQDNYGMPISLQCISLWRKRKHLQEPWSMGKNTQALCTQARGGYWTPNRRGARQRLYIALVQTKYKALIAKFHIDFVTATVLWQFTIWVKVMCNFSNHHHSIINL